MWWPEQRAAAVRTTTRRLATVVTVAVLLWSVPGDARDWFVRADSAGDGTIEKPFADPALALEEAGPGDVIHVTQGVYHGKLDAGNWVVATPKLTLLGGYTADFSQRDPWRLPSELRFSKTFHGQNSGTLIEGRGSHENFVLDGFVLDQKDPDVNANDPTANHIGFRADPIIRLSAPGATIRNCLILNGSDGGVDLSGTGARIENNIVLNVARAPLVSFTSHEQGTTLIRGNTFLFSWSDSGVGSGGTPAGTALSFWSSDNEFEVTDNIFLGCDNRAIHAHTADKLALRRNVFWLNGWLNVSVQTQDQELRVENANMSDLDDASLKACEGNVAANPDLAGLDPKWMGPFLDRLAEDYPKATPDDLNAMRRSLGLPAVSEKQPRELPRGSMSYDWAAALKIVPTTIKQGAHPVPLAVKPFSAPPASVPQDYQKATWQQLSDNPRPLDGRRVEVVGVLGREYSTFGFTGITEAEYRGFELHDVQERPGQAPVIYFKKGTKAERMLGDVQQWDGRGRPPERHLVRGLVSWNAASNTHAKGTIVVDSITAITESPAVESRARPVGRDWFVRAGASGDGTKDSPFKDPWQALEAAKAVDTIHVAEGEYFGRFRSGTWKVRTPYLGLLGGYDGTFSERDPWKHPTRLGYSPGGSESAPDAYVVGEDDHTGFIFDGFVLDGRDVNRLDANGNLASRFPEHPLLRLGSSDVVVRNCILVNAGGPALEAWGDNMHIENNIILNSNYYSLDLRGAVEQPYVMRHNTILFTWYADRGRGSRSGGSAIFTHPETRLQLDGNVVGYADGQGVLSGTDRKRLRIVNNVFTHNQVANVTDLDKVVIDDKAMDKMTELGFGASEGNAVLDPQFSFDPTWWAAYSRDPTAFFARPYDWKAAVKLLPQNPSCTAGARPQKLDVRFAP